MELYGGVNPFSVTSKADALLKTMPNTINYARWTGLKGETVRERRTGKSENLARIRTTHLTALVRRGRKGVLGQVHRPMSMLKVQWANEACSGCVRQGPGHERDQAFCIWDYSG